MKVITLKQPWATLVAEGIKKYKFLNLKYPSKKIIAEVENIDCLPLDENLNNLIIKETNVAYGNKVITGFAWKLDNIKKIELDEIMNGQLGFWNYDYDKKKK